VSIRNFADGHKKGCKATSFVMRLGEVGIYERSGSRKRRKSLDEKKVGLRFNMED
jgi:hypothetical protein